ASGVGAGGGSGRAKIGSDPRPGHLGRAGRWRKMRALLELFDARRRKRGFPDGLRTLCEGPFGNRAVGKCRKPGGGVLVSAASGARWLWISAGVLVVDRATKFAIERYTDSFLR